MSTIVAFSPMNLRLYDKEERELRTYVSPVFNCVAQANDPHGLCAHIVADNGGGKSTLLLFLEMVFCKTDRNGPNVGKKKAIDYLRRAAFDLNDTTPTTVAVLVRSDNDSVMSQSRDSVFGYTVRLRDSEGTSLDLRRFVIHLDENPRFTLEQLATEIVYDSNAAPRPQNEVWIRLKALDGCHTYESVEWNEYVQEMVRAGISPILWRELEKLNRDEEAAGTYFQSSDAFRNIVRLVSEAQEPMSGEKTKPLWDAAANIARQVSTQADDRLRETQCQKAGSSVQALADAVKRYADAREALKTLEDAAETGDRTLGDLQNETSQRIEDLQAREDLHKEQHLQNRKMRISRDIALENAELEKCREVEHAKREDHERKQQARMDAERRVCLDDAARSYRRFRELEKRYASKKREVEALKGNIEADEELRQASVRARGDLWAAEAASVHALKEAQDEHTAARVALEESEQAYRQADGQLVHNMAELGKAQGIYTSCMKNLSRLVAGVAAMESVQMTMDGFYMQQTMEALVKDAERRSRRAVQVFDQARAERTRHEQEHGESRDALQHAHTELAERRSQAAAWKEAFAAAREQEERLRASLSLWEEAVELAVTGRLSEARSHIEALRDDAISREQHARMAADRLKRKLDALEAGRLDMSDELRSWLDEHAIQARTLASYEGIAAQDRANMFARDPWLAHVLVVDGRTANTLAQATNNQDLSELGHPVFYINNTDVNELLQELGESSDAKASNEYGLIKCLHTLEEAYLDDPRSYAQRTSSAYEAVCTREKEAHNTARKLDRARDELTAYEYFFADKGFGENATLADVEAKKKAAVAAFEASEERVRTCEREELRLREQLEVDAEACAQADDAARKAAQEHRELQAIQECNAECVQAKDACGVAERAYDAAVLEKERCAHAQEDARGNERVKQEILDSMLRETEKIASLRKTLEGLCTVSLDEAAEGERAKLARSCSAEELRASVDALRSIVERNDRTLEHLQAELEEIGHQRDDESVWKMKMRDSERYEEAITTKELEDWVPSDDVMRNRLFKEEQRARGHEEEAMRALMLAENAVSQASDQLERYYADLRRMGLHKPLDIPADYDYEAVEAQIAAEAERDAQELHTARENTNIISSLLRRLGRVCDRASMHDGYRAKKQEDVPMLADLDAWEAHVSSLESGEEELGAQMREAAKSLERQQNDACDAVASMGEMTAARGIKSSAEAVMNTCATWDSMVQVQRGFEDHARQFDSFAATLRNKLRATDEAVDDFVVRSVTEGYRLMEELHRLVQISHVRMKGKGRGTERTIDFMAGGRSQFRRKIQRDEVATERLTRRIKVLLMEELPNLDEARMVDCAKTRLEPHELVYLLLGDRSVQVRYPVIRGGKRLSYESARDVGGSGSTGQKSAGYVLAFLALLRYLGSVGSLSSEKSLFVALENQFGKISSSKIILDIKEVVDQTNMQLITVAGRELRSAYAMGDVVFTLYRAKSAQKNGRDSSRVMRVQVDESDRLSEDAVIDKFRATRQFENLQFDI